MATDSLEMSRVWQNILKHQPKDKEGNNIGVKQEHINTISDWIESNEEHEEYALIKHWFDLWEKEDFDNDSDAYYSLKTFAKDGKLFSLYR